MAMVATSVQASFVVVGMRKNERVLFAV